jgi:hypothetical protein
LKIPVTIYNVTSVTMSCADFKEILEMASLPKGPLKQKNVLISGISKHALSLTLSNLRRIAERINKAFEQCAGNFNYVGLLW